jgi:predicted DNA-binding ribbon-helix-helix protein
LVATNGSRQFGCIALPEEADMKSLVAKRSIVIVGRKTSVSLEDAFWRGLKEIALGRDMTLSNMVAEIDTHRQQGNLSSAIRLFVLDRLRTQPPKYSADRVDGAATDKVILGNIQTYA